MPRGKKRKYSGDNDQDDINDNDSKPTKKRRISRGSNRSKSKPTRRSRRLAKKKGVELTPEPLNDITTNTLNTNNDKNISNVPTLEPLSTDNNQETENTDITINKPSPRSKKKKRKKSKSRSKSKSKSKSKSLSKSKKQQNKTKTKTKTKTKAKKKKKGKKNKKKKQINYNQHLFDETCLYSLLEVFIVAYDLNNNKNNTNDENDGIHLRSDIWEWLWEWDHYASSYYRILITPIYGHNAFEIRVDSIHGIQCGLLSEFLLNGLTFEYYYAYSRRHIWGGWKFCHKQKVIKHDIYGNIFGGGGCNGNDMTIIEPSKIWKQIIWFNQLKMERMFRKYNRFNMSRKNLEHIFYAQQNFKQIEGNPDIYINKFPPYQNANNNKKGNKIKYDPYAQEMSQMFDQVWCKQHQITRDTIRLNHDDLELILGTKQKMRCAQCHQTYLICQAVKLCECFKGLFFAKDLYQRHKSMVMDWK